jgi:hypothetical protein
MGRIPYWTSDGVDLHPDVAPGRSGDTGHDVDVHVRRLATLDPPHMRVRDARGHSDVPKTESGLDPGATKLLTDASQELAPSALPSLACCFTGRHSSILPIGPHPALRSRSSVTSRMTSRE